MLKVYTATTASLLLAMSSFGATNWVGSTSNDYTVSGNWDSGVPAPFIPGTISSGTAEFIPASPGLFELDYDLTIDGTGTLTVDNARLLNGRGGSATLTLADSGTLNQTGNYFIVGQNSNGTFNQTGGTLNVDVDRGFFISDGAGKASSYNLSGGVANVNLSGSYNSDLHNLWIGRTTESDTFTVSNNATFNLTNTNAAASQRRFYISGDSSFQVDGGTVNVDDFQYFIVGRGRIAGTSKFILNDGQVDLDLNLAMVVGGGEEGQVQVNGGDLTLSQGDIWLGDSGATTLGEMIQTAGDVVVSNGNIVLGRNALSRGEYTLSGGTLFAQDIELANDGEFNFNGGVLTLAGDRTDLISETWFNATAGTFATYDATADLTTIAVPEPGSLALLGLGGLLIARRRR